MQCPLKRPRESVCPMAGDLDLNELIEVVSAGFLYSFFSLLVVLRLTKYSTTQLHPAQSFSLCK
jgi:hypothetical protein